MIFPECSENKRDTLPRVRYDTGSEFKTGMSRVRSAAFIAGYVRRLKLSIFEQQPLSRKIQFLVGITRTMSTVYAVRYPNFAENTCFLLIFLFMFISANLCAVKVILA
jgi:hypothetical protein